MSSGGREDFTGKVIDPEKTGNGNITLYVERFEGYEKKKEVPLITINGNS